jgi:hypothetical protein
MDDRGQTVEEVLRGLNLRSTPPGPTPTEEQARAMALRELRSGPGTKIPDEQILRPRWSSEKERIPEMPLWLRALIEKKATDEEVIDALEKRLRRAPTHETLLLANALSRDLTRRTGNSEWLHKLLTQELVNAIAQKGG